MTRTRIEAVALLVALLLALIAVVGLAVALGSAFAPWVGWLALALVAGAVATVLARRALDERALLVGIERARPRAEPYVPASADGALSLPTGYNS